MTRSFRFHHLAGVLALGAAVFSSTAFAENQTSGTMTVTTAQTAAGTMSSEVVTRILPEQLDQLKVGTPITHNGERVGQLETVSYDKESGQARLKIQIDRAAMPKFANKDQVVDVKAGEVPIKMRVRHSGGKVSAERRLQRLEDVKIEQKPDAAPAAGEAPKAKESSSVAPKATLEVLTASVTELRTWAEAAPEAAELKADIVALDTRVKGLSAEADLAAATNELVRQSRELSSRLQSAGHGDRAENIEEAVAELRIALARS